MTIVKVATKNIIKIKPIDEVFEKYFGNVLCDVYDVKSEVPAQPINEEVFQGAENRIEQLKQIVKNGEYDYLVGCEDGLINLCGKWYGVQVITIEAQNGKRSTGISQGYPIPEEYVRKIVNSSVDDVVDDLVEDKGGIKYLTKNEVTKVDLVKNATMMALTRILNNDIW